jgi:hypothetical protein
VATRRIALTAPPVSDSVAATLLGGWGTRVPGAAPTVDDDELFALWVENEHGCATRWQQHRPYLETLAAAWGWAPTYRLRNGRACYFGELCTVPFAERAHH